MPHTVNTAIIGYGKSAKHFHVPLLKSLPDFKVTTVLQRSKDDALNDIEDVNIVRNLKDLLKDDSIDLVLITTPNHLHFEQAFDSLNADKHVVVEKPFTLTTEESEKLIRIAREKEKVLTVFQNRRWDGDYLTLKKIIEEGQLGTILEFQSSYNRFRRLKKGEVWKESAMDGSGILYDLAPHLIDQSLQLFGLPEYIFADIRHQRNGKADDWFTIDMFYSSLKVTLKAGMLVSDPTPRFILRGDDGAYVKYGMDVQEEQLASGMNPHQKGWGEEPASDHGILYKNVDGAIQEYPIKTLKGNYAKFYMGLQEAIVNKQDPPVDPESAKNVIKIIEIAIESNSSQKLLRV
tara:strand:- start:7287 stop:8330 length:1044 start_codon:yes stop_codon:yes gene_type:complete